MFSVAFASWNFNVSICILRLISFSVNGVPEVFMKILLNIMKIVVLSKTILSIQKYLVLYVIYIFDLDIFFFLP